jgi:hypothetical protein
VLVWASAHAHTETIISKQKKVCVLRLLESILIIAPTRLTYIGNCRYSLAFL